MTDEQVLRELMAAGLDSLPGGGAEIFAERVRRKIAHDKCGTDRYLDIHRTAHRLGLRSNVTMLYGHIETAEERVDHMLRARALQDETGGFQAFIPLAFHPDNNQMRKLPAPSAADTLRVHAVARLMLDNIPHVKAFWIATGVEVAQTALWFGVDDLDGTVQEEKIYHMAGVADARGDDAARDRAAHRGGRPRADRARHALQRRRRMRLSCDAAVRCMSLIGCPGFSPDASAGAWPFHSRLAKSFTSVTRSHHSHAAPGADRVREGRTSPSASRCPSGTSVCPTRRWTRASPPRGGARPSPRHPRPPLPARRGDQVRRLHRRLLQARAAGRPSIPTPTSSCSAACISWPRAPTC